MSPKSILLPKFNRTPSRKPSDQRRVSRFKTNASIAISLDGQSSAWACRLIDLSAVGARISIAPQDEIPNTFTLLLSKNALLGRPAKVRWRRGTEIGAEFIWQHSKSESSSGQKPKPRLLNLHNPR